MITRKQVIQLVVLAVIAVVSVAYVGLNYAGLSKVLGTGGYTITARFERSGGLFVGSEVTYRGVAVGSVTDISLTDTGLAVEMSVSEDAPPIPAGAKAAVVNRSPIGEQYIDLRPENGKPPYFSGGEVIPSKRTTVPVPVSTVLLNLDQLVTSIDKDALRTVVDEAYKAFAGAGDDLQTLLDNLSSFTETALDYAPQTQQLLDDARTVLRTQLENADNIKNFASGIARIAEQLKQSKPDLSAIIDRAPKVSEQVTSFLAESGSDLGVLLANLLTTTRITSKRKDSIEMLLIALPVIAAQAPSRAPDGTGHLGVVLNFFNPPSCTKGYQSTDQRPPSDTSYDPVNFDAYCALPPGSQTGVRGAQNAPRAGDAVLVPPGPKQARDSGGSGEKKTSEGTGGGTGVLPGMLGLSTLGELAGSVGDLLGIGG